MVSLGCLKLTGRVVAIADERFALIDRNMAEQDGESSSDVTNSRKKVPIVGMTTATSDKRFKRAEHSRERAAVKIALNQGEEPPSPRNFGDPVQGEKDGKQYLPEWKRALRK